MTQAPGRVVVLSGPAAVGKGTVMTQLRRLRPEAFVSVSATTRPARPGEVNGLHYWFLSDDEFDRLVVSGGLLEWATVHGAARYGTLRRPIEEAVTAGHTVILEIDLQGARQVKQSWPGAYFVFLAPPSWEELVRRLRGRGTESEEQQARRLRTADEEMAAQDEFDAVIVNEDSGQTVHKLVELTGL